MSSVNNTYGTRSNGGQHGDVFTKPCVVDYMLDMVGYTADKDLSTTSIMEPSCGEGEFIISIIERLAKSASRFGFDLNEAYHRNVNASDLDETKVLRCIERIKEAFPEIKNPSIKIIVEDYLLTEHAPADIVIGNPPYIRYEQMPEDKLVVYKSRFATFYYRADMYVLFFEHSLKQLKRGGRHCFICANRWMKNQYGKKLRKLVARHYNLTTIINMEGADAFVEEVLAYPAISLIEGRTGNDKLKFAETKDVEELRKLNFRELATPESADWSSVFNTVEQTSAFSLIEDQGFRIGIGVATGADSIFISNNIKGQVEDELLIPALNARDLQGDTMQWGGRYLLNPYDNNGRLIPLDAYPKAKRYFESHRERLSSRHKASKNPAAWYGTIDKITPPLQQQPKILLPDISGNTYVFVDEGKYYPQHNIYYITGGTKEQLQLLAALLMSDFVRTQLDNVTNKMNGGYARWQSQHLRKLHIPNVSEISTSLASALLDCYQKKNIAGINYYTQEIIEQETARPAKRSVPVRSRQLTLDFDFA
ncbi:MAG: N-6 DNA methylase [Bacteroidales bacterium]|nr:N-6 DNA methylase [Bacteroidales bacterium]